MIGTQLFKYDWHQQSKLTLMKWKLGFFLVPAPNTQVNKQAQYKHVSRDQMGLAQYKLLDYNPHAHTSILKEETK